MTFHLEETLKKCLFVDRVASGFLRVHFLFLIVQVKPFSIVFIFGLFICFYIAAFWKFFSESLVARQGLYRMAVSYYFDGDCTDPATVKKIKDQFIETLKTSKYEEGCSVSEDKCNIDNVEVIHKSWRFVILVHI